MLDAKILHYKSNVKDGKGVPSDTNHDVSLEWYNVDKNLWPNPKEYILHSGAEINQLKINNFFQKSQSYPEYLAKLTFSAWDNISRTFPEPSTLLKTE